MSLGAREVVRGDGDDVVGASWLTDGGCRSVHKLQVNGISVSCVCHCSGDGGFTVVVQVAMTVRLQSLSLCMLRSKRNHIKCRNYWWIYNQSLDLPNSITRMKNESG